MANERKQCKHCHGYGSIDDGDRSVIPCDKCCGDGLELPEVVTSTPRTHSDPIAALAHTNAELVKATERIRELEAKLAETPWEVRRTETSEVLSRYRDKGDARHWVAPWNRFKMTIRNAVTGEEVK